jgi:hypothetical protein
MSSIGNFFSGFLNFPFVVVFVVIVCIFSVFAVVVSFIVVFSLLCFCLNVWTILVMYVTCLLCPIVVLLPLG